MINGGDNTPNEDVQQLTIERNVRRGGHTGRDGRTGNAPTPVP